MDPSTPNGKLAKMLREVVENEQQEGMKFKIVETGGITVKSRFQKLNPTATQAAQLVTVFHAGVDYAQKDKKQNILARLVETSSLDIANTSKILKRRKPTAGSCNTKQKNIQARK